jgi:hypothetical protein
MWEPVLPALGRIFRLVLSKSSRREKECFAATRAWQSLTEKSVNTLFSDSTGRTEITKLVLSEKSLSYNKKSYPRQNS